MRGAIDLLAALLLLLGTYPLAMALRCNRTTTLWQPLLWALAAWSAWIGVAWLRALWPGADERLAVYAALCLTGCAGIAVLGARRPGALAWNFVVAGLLAVLMLPILNGLGELRLESAHEIFLAVTLLVPILNYLPTRLGMCAVLTAAGCGWETMRLLGWAAPPGFSDMGLLLLALAPWEAWAALARRRAATEFDRLWLAYRDRFGFVWGHRMQEQFNRAAHHAGWPVVLRWSELFITPAEPSPDPAALVATLRAVLKRFGSEEENAHG
jgi:hypothetical protein